MTKTSKRISWIVAGVLALFVIPPLALTPVVHMRQASAKPLSSETLAELGIALPRTDIPPEPIVQPDSATALQGSGGTSVTQASGPPIGVAAPLRLAAPGTATGYMQWRASFPRRFRDRAYTWVYLGFLKRFESVKWLTNPEETGGLDFEIGQKAWAAGDAETARTYLREALSKDRRPGVRAWVCVDLAWLEDDPEVATALLQESCATGDDVPVAFVDQLWNAVNLSVLTHSDALAEHYFERWSAVAGPERTEQFLHPIHPGSAEMEAWKERHPLPPLDRAVTPVSAEMEAWKERRARNSE